MAKSTTKKIFNSIDISHLQLASSSDKEKRIQSLSTKTKNMWMDIISRFFRNKWNVFFTVILLLLLISVYVMKYFTNFSPEGTVSKASQQNIHSLKPFWISDWNHEKIILSLSDYNNHVVPWLVKDHPESFDKYIISSHILNNPDGTPSGNLEVQYINPYAVKTVLGTDAVGQDVLTRLLYSAQWSLNLAFFVATIETIIGITIGIYLGYHVGKTADTVLMRFIDMFSSVPSLLWMFVFTLVIGTSFWSIALVLIIVGWVGPIYSARMFTIKIKDAEFILAARATGASQARILFSHILPNIIGRLLVSFVVRIPRVIFFETTLVFLGFKVGGDTSNSIGNLINAARSIDMMTSNVMFIVSISSFLLILTISMQIIANGIRDAFDPKVVR